MNFYSYSRHHFSRLNSEKSEFYESDMIDEEKWYLKVKREGSKGALTFDLSLPTYYRFDSGKLSFYIGPKERRKMSRLFKGATKVLTFIDGASQGNPGPSGAGVAFYDQVINRFS